MYLYGTIKNTNTVNKKNVRAYRNRQPDKNKEHIKRVFPPRPRLKNVFGRTHPANTCWRRRSYQCGDGCGSEGSIPNVREEGVERRVNRTVAARVRV